MCEQKYRNSVLPLDLQDGPDLISADEVIDANNLIRNLKSDWAKQLPKQKF